MNADPEVMDMIMKFLAVNAGAMLLLAGLSYVISALMLEGLAALDRWLDPSRRSKRS